MTDQHTIIYVMRHIDIGGHIEIPYKKVGITGQGNATLSSRLQQISSTKSPIQAQCIAAWSHNDARAVESALHILLDDNRVEGEWFYDKDDNLVERMQPMMELLEAQEIEIEGAKDSYSKYILKKESDSKSIANQKLLGEISELLQSPLRTSMRKGGPTLFSDKTSFTYYVGYRKSGNHKLSIGRSKAVFEQLRSFLEKQGYDVEQHSRGSAMIHGLSVDMLADLINITESKFNAT
ncbi:MAG: GIY-YIG nuclease family protein [Candidatus Thiodiazotropha taylori]|nr:GIY-YIG nuclease family protein [Candidatus Thiodiazotropha taylori]